MFSSVMKAAVLSAFCGLFYLAVWTDAAKSGRMYKVESLTFNINHDHVIATTQAKSAIHCSSKCDPLSCCRSSVFDVSTATCYLNNKTKSSSDMVQLREGKKLKYIEKQKCDSHAECFEKKLLFCEDRDSDSCLYCKQGKCICKNTDHHYRIIDNTCRIDCKNYDDIFEWYNDSFDNWSDKAKRSNVSFEECEEACLCETSFTCTWFAYTADSALCTYTDKFVNGKVYAGVVAGRYRRLCADP